KVNRGQKKIRDPLLAVEMTVEAVEEIPAIARRRNLEEAHSLRHVAGDASRVGEAHVQKRPAAGIPLVADRGEVKRLAPVRGGLNRIDEAQSRTLGVAQVYQEAAGQNIGVSEVHLKAAEVAGGVPV